MIRGAEGFDILSANLTSLLQTCASPGEALGA